MKIFMKTPREFMWVVIAKPTSATTNSGNSGLCGLTVNNILFECFAATQYETCLPLIDGRKADHRNTV